MKQDQIPIVAQQCSATTSVKSRYLKQLGHQKKELWPRQRFAQNLVNMPRFYFLPKCRTAKKVHRFQKKHNHHLTDVHSVSLNKHEVNNNGNLCSMSLNINYKLFKTFTVLKLEANSQQFLFTDSFWCRHVLLFSFPKKTRTEQTLWTTCCWAKQQDQVRLQYILQGGGRGGHELFECLFFPDWLHASQETKTVAWNLEAQLQLYFFPFPKTIPLQRTNSQAFPVAEAADLTGSISGQTFILHCMTHTSTVFVGSSIVLYPFSCIKERTTQLCQQNCFLDSEEQQIFVEFFRQRQVHYTGEENLSPDMSHTKWQLLTNNKWCTSTTLHTFKMQSLSHSPFFRKNLQQILFFNEIFTQNFFVSPSYSKKATWVNQTRSRLETLNCFRLSAGKFMQEARSYTGTNLYMVLQFCFLQIEFLLDTHTHARTHKSHRKCFSNPDP